MKIKFLTTSGYNDAGDIVEVVETDDLFFYYYDGMDRYCYIERSRLGEAFKIIIDEQALGLPSAIDQYLIRLRDEIEETQFIDNNIAEADSERRDLYKRLARLINEVYDDARNQG